MVQVVRDSAVNRLVINNGGTIGGNVSGGVAPGILYVGTGGVLAEDPTYFYYNDTTKDAIIGMNSFNQVINTHEIVGCLRWTANQNGQRVAHPFGTLPAVSTMANNGSGLIRVTTVYAHGLSTGAQVNITGATGTTEANGAWTVTVIDATNFDLQGSTFTNAYVSGAVAVAIIGTKDYTISTRVMVPTSNPSGTAGIVGITPNTTAFGTVSSLALFLTSTGTLIFRMYGPGSTSDTRSLTLTSNAVTTFGGNSIHIAITRASGGTPSIYINGTLFAATESTNGTPPNWSDSVIGSNFILGAFSNTQCWVDRIYNARFYSGIALSQMQINAEMVTGIANAYRWGNLLTPTTGCVIDSDLENAAPDISATVRDISTNAYAGTISGASFITQMEPTPQLNTSIFRLGGTTVRNGASGIANGTFVCQANTYQDTATAASGSATVYGFNVFRIPTLTAYNTAVTTTSASTLYIEGVPIAGTNMTITNALALHVAAGPVRVQGTLNLGVTVSDGILSITNTKTFTTALGTTGKMFSIGSSTITDPVTTTGTIAIAASNSISGNTFAFASGAVAITDAVTWYIPGIPSAGAGATISNLWGMWVSGKTRMDGSMFFNCGNSASPFGTNTNTTLLAGSSSEGIQLRAANTAIIPTIEYFYNTNSVSAGQSVGALKWWAGTTPAEGSRIESLQVGTTEGINDMLFYTSASAGTPVERLRITSAGLFNIWDGGNFVLGSTTGSKIGTATTQKLAFYNSTPIVQPATTGTATGFTAGAGTGVTDQSTFTGGTGATAYRISDIVLALKTLGLMAA